MQNLSWREVTREGIKRERDDTVEGKPREDKDKEKQLFQDPPPSKVTAAKSE